MGISTNVEVHADRARPDPTLEDGSRVAVIGSGPAGSLFSYFLLEMAERITKVSVDIYESRKFTQPGPAGCNMCGGIVSETLVQNLSIEGVTLPAGVVQRGIESYVLHTDAGSVRIRTPLAEMRIGAMHRGAGPRDAKTAKWESFDHHLQARALAAGARLVGKRVEKVDRVDGKPTIHTKCGSVETYDLLVLAVGVNSPLLETLEGLGIGYERPRVTRTLIREYHLGEEVINRSLRSAMHVFLPNIPRLEFACAVPKGDYVTMAVLGEDVDDRLMESFLAAPEMRRCMPPEWKPEARSCQCMPKMAVRGAPKPYADRVVFIGDCGVTRLYKDGIGAAYRTAKAAARTALFEGISEQAFARRYMPICRSIAKDNVAGRLAFFLTRLARASSLLRRAMLRMVAREQMLPGPRRRMSGILWDMFSGSAPYGDILGRMLKPAFLAKFLGSIVASFFSGLGPPPLDPCECEMIALEEGARPCAGTQADPPARSPSQVDTAPLSPVELDEKEREEPFARSRRETNA